MKLVLRYKMYIGGMLLVLLGLALWSTYLTPKRYFGAAPVGFSAVNGTSTTITMTASNDESELFATSTCITRVITTGTKNIRLKFFDFATPTLSATVGHLQTASTTKEYDAGTYGCGLVTGLSTDADTVTVSELKDFR